MDCSYVPKLIFRYLAGSDSYTLRQWCLFFPPPINRRAQTSTGTMKTDLCFTGRKYTSCALLKPGSLRDVLRTCTNRKEYDVLSSCPVLILSQGYLIFHGLTHRRDTAENKLVCKRVPLRKLKLIMWML